MKTNNSWDFFPIQLPERLKNEAILLYESNGVHDIAWNDESIFEVIEFLKANSIMILGGDVLDKKNNHYDFIGDNWSVDGYNVEKGYTTAKAFIMKYISIHGNRFIFTLICKPALRDM
jgi:hypothetical protein